MGFWDDIQEYGAESGRRLSEGARDLYDVYRNRDVNEALRLAQGAAEPFTGAKGPIGQALHVAKSIYQGAPPHYMGQAQAEPIEQAPLRGTMGYADGGMALPMRFPWGPRYNPETGRMDSRELKDIGFYGPIKSPNGDVVSEYSSGDRLGEYPTVTQGLTREQLDRLIRSASTPRPPWRDEYGVPPDQDIADAAWENAQQRRAEGRSPFYEPGKDPYPKWSPEQDWPEPQHFEDGGWADPIKNAYNVAKQYMTSDPNDMMMALPPSMTREIPSGHFGEKLGAAYDAAKTMGYGALMAAPDPMKQDPVEMASNFIPMTGAIKAYHGSPHQFDRFDLSKIGTGEGAQAYGHGLYFAENEGVAQQYKRDLANKIDVNGNPFVVANRRVGTTGDSYLDDIISAHSGDIEKALADEIAHRATLTPAQASRSGQDEIIRKLQELRGKVNVTNDGHMYEVNINAEPHQFLDWDKPLSEQHQAVQEAYAKARGAPIIPDRSAQAAYADLYLTPGANAAAKTGMDRQAYASQAIREAGIPGIKYLDQGSRGAGDGSRNYVVFSPEIIDILRRYAMGGEVENATRLARRYADGGRSV
jgi:hypothetical protein